MKAENTVADHTPPDLDKYYYYLNMITENVRNGYNYMVLMYCDKSLPLIPLLIEETKKNFGEFDITTIPAIELGAKLWSYQGNEAKIKELERLIGAHPELTPWNIHIERAYQRLRKSGE